MSQGAVAVDKVYEDDDVFAIKDINPRAPVHVMIIPRAHIPSAAQLTEAEAPLLSQMFATANRVAQLQNVDKSGYRLTFNVGNDGGQTIYHLHLHLLGGRELGAEA